MKYLRSLILVFCALCSSVAVSQVITQTEQTTTTTTPATSGPVTGLETGTMTTTPAPGTTSNTGIAPERKMIISPAPKSVNCRTVASHWEGQVWVSQQTICNYENRAEGTAWVQDYWACTTYTENGDCTSWEYRPGHWIKTAP